MSRLNFNLERETEFSAMNNHKFLLELERALVISKEVTYFTNRDPLLSKVYNYVNHGWRNIIKKELKPLFRGSKS